MTLIDISIPSTGSDVGEHQTFTLSDYRGQNVILFFYPKDNTPGCTNEAIAFREQYAQFANANTIIFGVSRDSLKSHDNFKQKLALPFDLIADTEELLCNQFQVIKQKIMYGKQVRGIERSTFIIDVNGLLIHEWRKVKVNNHVDEVLSVIQSLN